MGVSIHYRGRLDSPDQLLVLREQLMSIASGLEWQFHVLDEDWSIPANPVLDHSGGVAEIKGPLGLKGIQLQPPGKSEPLDFFFDLKGYLLSPLNAVRVHEGELSIDDAWISVKTQFVPANMHVMIIGLLKYIKEYYIPNLEVRDEGGYLETGDYQVLQDKRKVIQEKIDSLSYKFSSEYFSDLEGLSADEIATRIELFLQAENMKLRRDN